MELRDKTNLSKIESIKGFILDGKIRGGPNFGPVKYVKEVSHVKHMHVDSILVHHNFSGHVMVM